MLNHGVSTGALFLLVGVIYDRRHTRLVREFGGLAKVMPIYAAVFVVVTMSSVGVPGTNGFVGEFMVLMSSFVSTTLQRVGGKQIGVGQGIAAAFGVVLAAVYMLSVVQKMFFGPITNDKNRRLNDLNVRETVALAPLIALIFVIGFFPSLFLDRMSESTTATIDRFFEGRRAFRDLGDSDKPTLLLRRGGPLERGIPEAPKKPGETGAVAQAAAAAEGGEP
jgi:NADH-quinone oxidoreductase subunit M